MTAVFSPMAAVQTAIMGRLRTDEQLGELVSGVYDYLPETTPFPYVVVGEATETPDNAHDRYGRQTTVTLHVWSQYHGYAQAHQIADRVTALLDHQPLTVIGLTHIVTRYEFSQTLTDPETPGNIRHVVLRYRIITEQPPA
ncbi:DUF3168 domain-containing protein [Streptomyces sp. NPDC059499]|uniref:DUF3168 domain-containing protein n=1 Tax=Streptomyces sp. NPDC059499 TaxID=3346852 RepID=UPI0036A50B52